MIHETRTENFASIAGLDDAERQPCEIWTRVMGFHRPLASFNQGKQGEFYERQSCRETACCGKV